MKAVIIPKAFELQVIDMEKPQLQTSTDVLVKVKRVGICGSDMHIYHGTNPLATYPRIIGHEVAGEVIAVGDDVSNVKIGDHVVVEPLRNCGICYACRNDRPNVCKELTVFGVHEDGGMREWLVLSAKQLYVVDAALDWDEVVLVEPYTIGAQAIWRGGVSRGDTVLIQGCGPIGICILKMAKIYGATVVMTDISQERLLFARANRADFIINGNTENVIDRIDKITNGEGVNVVIDAVCLPSTFELGVEVASVAGTIVVLGFDSRPASISQLPITKKELTIVGSRLQTRQFEKVIALLNEGALRQNELITHRFSIDDVQEAFSVIEKYPNKVRKAVIQFE